MMLREMGSMNCNCWRRVMVLPSASVLKSVLFMPKMPVMKERGSWDFRSAGHGALLDWEQDLQR